jgi:hypothetical protein
MWDLKSPNSRQWNITPSLKYGDTSPFQATLAAVISKTTMDHELENIRNAASHILRYNINTVKLMKEPEHLSHDDAALDWDMNMGRLEHKEGPPKTWVEMW